MVKPLPLNPVATRTLRTSLGLLAIALLDSNDPVSCCGLTTDHCKLVTDYWLLPVTGH
jgi:hypothetical protein